jgi:hypothetical protein
MMLMLALQDGQLVVVSVTPRERETLPYIAKGRDIFLQATTVLVLVVILYMSFHVAPYPYYLSTACIYGISTPIRS